MDHRGLHSRSMPNPAPRSFSGCTKASSGLDYKHRSVCTSRRPAAAPWAPQPDKASPLGSFDMRATAV